MAREIDATTLGTIQSGGYPRTNLLLFDLAGVLYGFWSGAGTLNVSGVDYVGSGSLIQVEALSAGVELSASPLQVTLRSVPETALSPDVLATIDDEAYKNAPAYLSRAYFNRDTGMPVNVFRLWRGYVDIVRHEWTVGGDYILTGMLEPRSLDHSRRGVRTRSDADQKLLDPTDRFFEHAATVVTEKLPYGRKGDARGELGGGVGHGGGGQF